MTSPPAIHAEAKFDHNRFLHALAEVESGDDPNKVGAAGERTRWQITPEVWKQHLLNWPFAKFSGFHALARKCADMHLRWLIRSLEVDGVCITPSTLATCWRFGLHGGMELIKAGKIPDSANRVRNLYYAQVP